MVDLPQVINGNTFIISDTHLGHQRVLQFEPTRVKLLLKHFEGFSDKTIIERSDYLFKLLETVPEDDQRMHPDINSVCKDLIHYHDEMIISNWNRNVGVNDTVLHLGDFAFRNLEKNTERLNGRKILLRGNHDRKSSRHYKNCGWDEVIDAITIVLNGHMFNHSPSPGRFWNGLFIQIGDMKILFSHYPIRNSDKWDIKQYGTITDMLSNIYDGYGCDVNVHGHIHSHKSIFEHSVNVSSEHINFTPQRIKNLVNLNGKNS